MLPLGLRWHLWRRRQLRSLRIMRPLSRSVCVTCGTPWSANAPLHPIDRDWTMSCLACNPAFYDHSTGETTILSGVPSYTPKQADEGTQPKPS